ncbi:MAG: thioredoxin domain-containing protein, partial [Fidelibacterota bacterium]
QDREKIQSTVADVQTYLRSRIKLPEERLPDQILEQTFRQFAGDFDSLHGGFGMAPKFPAPQNLLFLLRYAYDTGDSSALNMVVKTLTALRYGGIFDQVGFGFHRYSTDARWLVPHFEKMLYDQAMLLMTYAEAYQMTGDPLYARTTREIITYLTRDMQSPTGGFYSAEDADSEGSEGKFYLWTLREIQDILGSEADWVIPYFGMTEAGNFSEAGSPRDGANILQVAVEPESFASAHGWSQNQLNRKITAVTKRLYQARSQRPYPLKDTKILTDWNGLTVVALARTGMALNSPEIVALAEKTYRYLLDQCRDQTGRLFKRWIDGAADLPGQLDDYAFVIWGGLTLYQATGNPEFLDSTIKLAEIAVNEFWDSDKGGFFLGSESRSDLPVRLKTAYDGALPSGNSIMALSLTQLGRLTGDSEWVNKADRIINVFSGEIARIPRGYAGMLLTLYYDRPSSREIVMVRSSKTPGSETDFSKLRAVYLPNSVILEKTGSGSAVQKSIPWLAGYATINEQPTYYVCRNYACEQPRTSLESVLRSLNPQSPKVTE